MRSHQVGLYDVTVSVSAALPVWPGDPPVQIQPVSRMADGEVCNVSHISLSNHAGTHVDAPWHFDETGVRLDEIPVERWVGPCFVADMRSVESVVQAADLDAVRIPDGTERLLLRTKNSDLWHAHFTAFVEDYVALSPAAARWIVDRQIRLVGIDYYSVDSFVDDTHEGHHILLGNDVLIIENLDLSRIAAGPYQLLCLPLKLDRLDGAPARVILMDPV